MRTLQPCGTEAAYSRHRSNGEDACDACKAAHVRYESERKQRRRRVIPTPQPLPARRLYPKWAFDIEAAIARAADAAVYSPAGLKHRVD